ncbi:hypothetical protein V1280_004649 [Bradyrhizobium sp. AZCC 2230]
MAGAICRHAAMRIAQGNATRIIITVSDLQAILGPKSFEQEIAMRTTVPGVATGLAWTPAGGDIQFVEATKHSWPRQADPHRPVGRRDEGKWASRADGRSAASVHARSVSTAQFAKKAWRQECRRSRP